MRILHITYIFPTKLGVADGITNVAFNVCNQLAKDGHNVSVYTSNMLDLHGRARLQSGRNSVFGIDVHYENSILYSNTLTVTPSIIPLLSKSIENFDVIHIHDSRSFQGITTYLFAKLRKVPYVFQPHGSFLHTHVDPSLKKLLKISIDSMISSKIVKNASKIIAISEKEALQYQQYGIPRSRIDIVPNGLDLSSFSILPKSNIFKVMFNIPECTKVILSVGRINRTKGLDFLIKAFAYMVNAMKVKDTILVIAGPDDGYLQAIKQLISVLKIEDRVIFTGLLSEYVKKSAYMCSNIVVNVEPVNVYGLVPIEAAACSTPVIVSEGNAIKNFVNEGQFGFSIEYGCINELAEKMNKLISDCSLAVQMGNRGKKYVFENLGWGPIVTKLENTYKTVVSS